MIHTVSLEMAKNLKAAGWEKSTEMFWANISREVLNFDGEGEFKSERVWEVTRLEDLPTITEEIDIIPAPTAGELLREMQGVDMAIQHKHYVIGVRYKTKPSKILGSANTPEDALAAAWIAEYGRK